MPYIKYCLCEKKEMKITICDNDVLYRESPAIRSRFSDTVYKLLRDKGLAMCGASICHSSDEKIAHLLLHWNEIT